MKLLMIDNYDSFTFNLVQYFGELGAEVAVVRNDETSLQDIAERTPDRLVISPGPCSPKEAGISVEAIRHFAGRIPLLGVCLGHQAIAEAFGGEVVRAGQQMHGKTSVITTDEKGVFAGLPKQFTASSLPPPARMARSRACATANWRSRACSFTPRASSPNTAMRCCATFWSSAEFQEKPGFGAYR